MSEPVPVIWRVVIVVEYEPGLTYRIAREVDVTEAAKRDDTICSTLIGSMQLELDRECEIQGIPQAGWKEFK